jgi:ornithine cyclodeaminase
MKVLVVNQSEVARLLPMGECIEAMAEALRALGRGQVVQPLRQVTRLPRQIGALATMPSYADPLGGTAVKVITVYRGNQGTAYDAHQGAVLLFEAEHGSLRAIVDATAVTAIRTAAVSAVATRALARDDAADLTILGSGAQARTHLAAMLQVRHIRRVRVWSPHAERRDRFAEYESRRHNVEVEAMASAQSAVAGADLICTVTSARTPVLKGKWIAPGAHVNAVGACFPTTRELDTEAVRRARVFVDRRESALAEAGDLLIPKGEGAVGDDHIRGELGEVLLGAVRGRSGDEEVTLFKSLGLAVEDLAAARLIYQRAQEQQAGTWIEFGGGREAD